MTQKDRPVIVLEHASLDEQDEQIVAHGWITVDSLDALRTDDYQREVLHQSKTRKSGIIHALEKGERLPDIILGMRGQKFETHGQKMTLENDVYIIDGLQRVSAMRHIAENSSNGILENLRIGAEVRFSTNRDIERDLFLTLNGGRIPVSPNVILRDIRDQNRAVLTLYGLSHSDKDFPLVNRVQWSQRRERGQLVTALGLVKVGSMLHRHVPTSARRPVGDASNLGKNPAGGGKLSSNLANTMEVRAEKVGLRTFRKNVSTFFEVLDEAFGIRTVEYTQMATHLRMNFLETVARVFSDHSDFWKGDEFIVPAAYKKKLRTFPIQDPEIARLAAAGSMTLPILYGYVRNHLNKRMKRKLHARHKSVSTDIDEMFEQEEARAEA